MNRRGFLSGLLFAPAIIRTPGLLMAVRPLRQSPLLLIDLQMELGVAGTIISDWQLSIQDMILYGAYVTKTGPDGLNVRVPPSEWKGIPPAPDWLIYSNVKTESFS